MINFLKRNCVDMSNLKEVVDISILVLALGLFIVDDPHVGVQDVLVEVLALQQVQSNEPLVGDVVELHVVLDFPAIERTAEVH